jgi:two-component system nitrate/nitrite response regulator NarL
MKTTLLFRGDKKPEIQLPVRILIADSHALFREGLHKLLESYGDINVVGQADGRNVLELVHASKPDILLLDLSINQIDGLQVLRRIRRVPGVRTIILTATIGQQESLRALRLGASAVLKKESSLEQLLDCIRSVHAGEVRIGKDTDARLTDMRRKTTGSAQSSIDVRARITKREMDVIAAIVAGCTNKKIAARLSISEQTIKHHLSSIFDKTGVSSRLELAIYARENKLVRDPAPVPTSETILI